MTLSIMDARPPDEHVPEDEVEQVRAFNRFYTRVIGVLREGLLHTPYSLTEARVIFELAQHQETDAAELRAALSLDPGQLSRVLSRLESRGLVTRDRSPEDARRQVLRLTGAGREAFALLDSRSRDEIDGLLRDIDPDGRRRLLTAMRTIREVLGRAPRPDAFLLRPLRPGDLGWVVHRHGVLYAEEYGWDETFEALVAEVVARFGAGHDARSETAWIAEVDGEPAGCVFVVRHDEQTAQLRLLLVEPSAGGLGIGSRLVEEAIRFAQRAGYGRMMLWTNHPLVDARRLYDRAGFQLTREEPHRSFGHDLVGQYMERDL
jgi:DNA-binding MarR family transcriptional regulator/ribosomal protein S18 acetylase RimI-like enzyme